MALKVVTGYGYSRAHQRFYANGTRTYRDDGTQSRTLSMSSRCVCGDPVYDGDPICAERYDAERWEIVHVRCCAQHNHEEDF